MASLTVLGKVLLATLLAAAAAAVQLPPLPQALQQTPPPAAEQFLDLWHRSMVEQQRINFTMDNQEAPKTIISPSNHVVTNFAPQDVPSPLYSLQGRFVELKTKLVRDYLVADLVEPEDKNLLNPDGFAVRNLNNKTIVFEKNATGTVTINDFPVVNMISVEDAQIYVIDGALFDHMEQVAEGSRALFDEHSAFDAPMPQDERRFGPKNSTENI
ncbi:uncharacterized protein LOC108672246 [Hyalella azteca]|uniref:Uncharacterized protein LOC108672246 n=1 Tax=Hyalella azteca TaxID=294128 RepID=A0A8B7NQK5_HYAAZ|nr:uncharacterized protein LOC108672246 [Hyalella azteca]